MTDEHGGVSVILNHRTQYNFSGSNTDGLFTKAVSNMCLSP